MQDVQRQSMRSQKTSQSNLFQQTQEESLMDRMSRRLASPPNSISIPHSPTQLNSANIYKTPQCPCFKNTQQQTLAQYNMLFIFFVFSVIGLIIQYISYMNDPNTTIYLTKQEYENRLINNHTKIQIYTENDQIIKLKYPQMKVIYNYQLQKNINNDRMQKMLDIGQTNTQEINKIIKDNDDLVNLTVFMKNMENRQLVSKVQYQYFKDKYKLDSKHIQLPICIVSTFQNLMKNKQQKDLQQYLYPLQKQNYTNYKIVLIDDRSNDNSSQIIKQSINRKYPRIKRRLVLLQNQQQIGKFGSLDIAIRKYCNFNSVFLQKQKQTKSKIDKNNKNDTIIVQLDGNDEIIGLQVLNIINSKYIDNTNIWFIYSDYIQKIGQIFKRGDNKKINDKYMEENSYRLIPEYWVTKYIRSYYRKLYMKIPIEYLLESQGTYYVQNGDRFYIYPMIEMAGNKHMYYLDMVSYFHNKQKQDILTSPSDLTLKSCTAMINQCKAKMQVPLQSLRNMLSTAKNTQNYIIPKETLLYCQKIKDKFDRCSKGIGLNENNKQNQGIRYKLI